MTQEDKDLLFRDLCARIPYGVIIQVKDWKTLDTELKLGHINRLQINDVEIKPYLFPLSSMNEEQYKEFFEYFHTIEMNEIKSSGDYLKAAYLGEDAKRDWLNKNHFDYRYLIPKDLAIDATGLNIY